MGEGFFNQSAVTTAALAFIIALAAVIGSVDNIISFRVCFGVLLIIFSVAQFRLAINLYQHRNDLLLELFQPVGLSLFVAAGAIATLTSFLIALPEYDASCALRQPIILTCISFMGNILIARAWRIGCIISPTAVFAVASDEIDRIRMMRMKVMNSLSTLSGWGRFVGSCGRAKRGNKMKRTMRITVTFADSIRVAMMLLVPQLVLQVINLSVPNVRMQSIELTEGFHVCESGAGVIILIVGIVLAAIPFFVALLINISSEGIPDRFRELKDILKSTSTSFCVLIITLPTAGMIRMMVPAAHAYLLSASVLSFVLPLSYNIAQTRANVIKSTGIAKGSARSVVKKRKKVTRPVSSSSSSHEEEDNLLILEAAEEAVTMGKMFDAMGSKSKAVDINEDILTLFKVEDDFSWEVGFTLSEVHSLGPKSLEIVVTTLIASSKLFWAMFRSNPENGEQAKTRTFKSCMDALDIFDKAPAKKQLRDHSIVFPGYSFMNEIAKAMPYKPPNNLPQDEFEKGLADNFLRATNHQQYHHCIALAMQADVMRRQGKQEEAIVVIEEMKSIYDPGLHSRAILKEYVKDHCCETVAVIANWLSQDGRIEEAMKLCDDVIEALPEMKGTGAVQSKYFALCLVAHLPCYDRAGTS